jgi:elongator complex protein 4
VPTTIRNESPSTRQEKFSPAEVSNLSRSTDKSGQNVSSEPKLQIQGCKNWLNNQYMVSTGLKQLDEILGGGIILGSAFYLEEDQYSSHAETLMAYSIAESICTNCKTILLVATLEDAERILSSLPFNLTLRHQDKEYNSELPSNSINPDNSDSANDTDSPKSELKIAWQYEKYLNSGPFHA